MKKFLAIFLSLVMIFSFAACGEKKEATPENTSAIEEVKGVTIPEFKTKICGVKVTNEDMAAYPLYKITANTVNSSGTEHSNVYIGFKLSDVLEACEITGTLGKLTAVATDGYEVAFEGDIMDDTVLLAISKDGGQFKDGLWFAPCSSETTGDYLQDLKKIEIDGASSPKAGSEGGSEGSSESSGSDLALADPVAEDKSDKITFADFSFNVNGKAVTNADLEGLKIWRITVTVENSKGAISESKYSGYVLKEVLAKCGIENPASVKAVADDGYESDLSADVIASDLTIVAIEKDKATGDNGTVWLAPCTSQTSGDYAKNVINIEAK